MRFGRPSPSLAVSLAALVMASAGTAVAAVDYAQNAGAVDGKSAVGNGASLKRAAGRLVATQRRGADRGRIATKYLDLDGTVHGRSSTFGRSFAVVDNQVLAPTAIGTVPGIGTVTATCTDENQVAGRMNPATTIAVANTSGEAVNLSRSVGSNPYEIGALLDGTQTSFTIRGSNAFELHLERRGVNYAVHGVVRQDGRGTAAAACLVYGYALQVPPS
ncbi:MAG TPA: hypothetical protein VLA98_07830 [Solirubrobacteraceae bacterium]|nr:hypothetical protein [Solirubrobacteraceae bacterium]